MDDSDSRRSGNMTFQWDVTSIASSSSSRPRTLICAGPWRTDLLFESIVQRHAVGALIVGLQIGLYRLVTATQPVHDELIRQVLDIAHELKALIRAPNPERQAPYPNRVRLVERSNGEIVLNRALIGVI